MIFDKEEHKEIVLQLIETSIYRGNFQEIENLCQAIKEVKQAVIIAKIRRKKKE